MAATWILRGFGYDSCVTTTVMMTSLGVFEARNLQKFIMGFIRLLVGNGRATMCPFIMHGGTSVDMLIATAEA